VRLATPRVMIAGLAGDSGKTLISLGLVRALRDRGLAVAAFKKGPDYIDAAWLGVAAGRPGRNLDTFLMTPAALGQALAPAQAADLMVVEGNRGLFDGMDAEGTHSSAALAARLGSPVVLVVDATKATRTVAALVLGCRVFDPAVDLAGVVLNRVGTGRQEALIRRAVEEAAGVDVVGALPRLDESAGLFPGRHLGLVTAAERPERDEAVRRAAQAVAQHVDVERILAIARRARHVDFPRQAWPRSGPPVRVAVLRDEAFSFYYPENLEALEAAGVELVFASPLHDAALPEVDGVVVGGGFPEVHAERLAGNRTFLSSLGRAAALGVPIYAECGGLMLLARTLTVAGRTFEMAGVLDLHVEQGQRPSGHGYVEGRVDGENPFLPVGTPLRGHEFHYSAVCGGSDAPRTVVALERGTGLGGRRDAVVRGSVWASYLHLHALSLPRWAQGVAEAARRCAASGSGAQPAWA